MNKTGMILAVLSFICLSLTAKAQQQITGYWYDDTKEAKIEIYQAKNGKYYGKIVWLKEPYIDGKPKTDTKNSKEALRKRPLMGLVILKELDKSSDGYEDGTIYDPKSGKTYSCNAELKDANHLKLRGYIGISLIGRTTIWTRASD